MYFQLVILILQSILLLCAYSILFISTIQAYYFVNTSLLINHPQFFNFMLLNQVNTPEDLVETGTTVNLTNNAVAPEEEEIKPKRKSSSPTTDADIVNTLETALQKMELAGLSFSVLDLAIVKKVSEDISLSYSAKQNKKSSRRPAANDIKVLDKECNSNIELVKYDLKSELGSTAAIANYPMLGIVRNGSHGYRLPAARNERLSALQTLVSNLPNYSKAANDTNHGLAYWTDFLDRYSAVAVETQSLAGESSKEVGDFDLLKADAKKYLNCIIALIKANYPDNWENMLRFYGFLKERF